MVLKRMVTMWLILMVIIWLMMVNNNLVGGAITPLKKYEFVNGKDDIPLWKINSLLSTSKTW
jgi:hypothetical protein